MLKRKASVLEKEKQENELMSVDDTHSLTAHRRPDLDKLQSLKSLRNKVKSETDLSLRELIANHSFVGSIDRELSLIQHTTSLYIVNTPAITKQLFYQLALKDFGNFSAIRLNPPAPIKDLAKLALDNTGT